MIDLKLPPTESDAIEAQLQRDRDRIAASVVALRQRLSAETLLRQGGSLAKTQARSAARAVEAAVRGNPIAATIAVAGVAWLIFGRKRQPEPARPAAPEPALAGTKFEALTRWEDEGGPAAPENPPSPEAEPDPDPAADGSQNLARKLVAGHPLLAGVAALVLGSTLAALLPISRSEQRLLAGPADSLLDEARRLFALEREQASALAAELAGGLQEDLRPASARPAETASAETTSSETASSETARSGVSNSHDRPPG